jgi:hypothetical protein
MFLAWKEGFANKEFSEIHDPDQNFLLCQQVGLDRKKYRIGTVSDLHFQIIS